MKRYISHLNGNEAIIKTDVLIIGSGIAGVYTALCIKPHINVTVLAKEEINISNSALAQGGIAVSLGEEDSPKYHKDDTVYAGAGLSDDEMVWIMVSEARQNILDLCGLGVNFDMKGGALSLTKEAAHSKRRIIHAGDFTGKEVCDKLIAAAEEKANITFREKTFAIDIITEGNQCRGAIALDQKEGRQIIFECNHVICASGGFGQLYKNTTNPIIATGDGMAMAYRAGATLVDMEFVQFHPTALYHEKNKSFLISEAVRGEGAVLRNNKSERFMEKYHELRELAPRDVVARAIFKEMTENETECVYLDITHKDREYLKNRFPKIFGTCLEYGIDISKDYIPVAPAEHYCMGGIRTDSLGNTGIENLYACGEVACTGIHGANRLASNSLLEGLVFGYRIAREINTSEPVEKSPLKMKSPGNWGSFKRPRSEYEKEIKNIMSRYAGIIRNGAGLEKAFDKLDGILHELSDSRCRSTAQCQVVNMAIVARTVVSSAIKRTESRGAHFRSDFPETSEDWIRHIENTRRRMDDETYELND
jgi:L-aspartate oxidase